MTLLERIETDLANARRAGDTTEREALIFLLSEARAPGKNKRNGESTDAEVIDIIRKLIGGDRDTIAAIMGTLRADLIPLLEANIARLTAYLPVQMDEAELETIITGLIGDAEKNGKLVGIVMGRLKTDRPGEYDPTLASQIARRLIMG